MELVARTTEKGRKVYNNAFYTVLAIASGTVRLRDDDVGGEIEIPLGSTQKYFRGRGALTYDGAQGRTLPGRVVCFGLRSKRMTREHLVVGISRATGLEFFACAP